MVEKESRLLLKVSKAFETALSIINQATISLELPDTWKRSRILSDW